jgi:GNAT superfamily N-acetyltransferase
MSANHFRVRDATLADAEWIAALVTQLSYQTSVNDMKLRLERLLPHPEHLMVVAEASGDIVGLVAAHIGQGLESNDPHARITGLVVDRHWRGSGIGRMLMEHMESRCRNRGVHNVILTSGNQRVDAHQFYQHMGYTATGQRFIKRL